MKQGIRIWHKEIYPIPQWVYVCLEEDRGKYRDEDIYFYCDENELPFKQWDYIMLDEEFLVVEVEE